MSILKVDKINEKTSGNGVAIPGHIIQVTKSVITSNVQATSSSYLDVGHSLVITPKFANSLILLQNSATGWHYDAGNPEIAGIRCKRNGSVIFTNDGQAFTDDSDWSTFWWGFNFFDTTHSSTSALTYTLEINGNRTRYNDQSAAVNTATFLAMEIAQ